MSKSNIQPDSLVAQAFDSVKSRATSDAIQRGMSTSQVIESARDEFAAWYAELGIRHDKPAPNYGMNLRRNLRRIIK